MPRIASALLPDRAFDRKSAIASRVYSIEAEPNTISASVQPILRELFRVGLSMPETVAQSEIALVEVLNNIAEHAYRDQSGQIELHWHLTETEIWFETKDRGIEMPGHMLPDPDCPRHDVALENLPEGGFGWFLVRRLAAELIYERRDGINIVRFAIPRSS